MKRTAAQLAVFALEQIGVKYTFGIPGTHTTELYDAVDKSDQIEPILVTHEAGGAFMADAISRTSDSIGVITIVPAAGLTQSMSGIGEAFLDGIPMLVIAGGVRRDSGKSYQLHHFDQMELAKPITKAQFLIEDHKSVISTIYEAYEIAVSEEPGPVFIEIPVNLMLFAEAVPDMPKYLQPVAPNNIDNSMVDQAVNLIKKAKFPMLFVGWGTLDANQEIIELAEKIVAPVCTTLQGKSAFPNSHPLYTSVGLGASSKPSAQWALKNHDVLIAIGTRFGEIATGSYGLDQPNNLIHIDINPTVFDKNYKSTVAIESDSRVAVEAILKALKNDGYETTRDIDGVSKEIEKRNATYSATWLTGKKDDIVSPGYFFKELDKQLDEDPMVVLDDGKHTFLASELLPIQKPRHFISPTDFNCMGYCVPAAIATQLAHPNKQVVAIIGDGAFQMTGLEAITAAAYELPIMMFIFNDGQLGQISQFQKIPLNRNTCSVIGKANFEGVAIATGAHYISIESDLELEQKIAEAIETSKNGKHVVVDIKIDYSQKTMMTKGVVKVNFKRFPFTEKIRFLTRAAKRHLVG